MNIKTYFVKKAGAIFTSKLLLFGFLFLIVLTAPAEAHHSLSFDVDRPNGYYSHGKEDITFTAKNSGNDDAYVYCTGVWVYDNMGNLVAWEVTPLTVCTGESYIVNAGGFHVFIWDQINDNNNKLVPIGKYYGELAVYDKNNNKKIYKTNTFDIDVDSDGDGYLDGLDNCPKTSGNGKSDAARGCPDLDEDGVPDKLDDGSSGGKNGTDACAPSDTADADSTAWDETPNGYIDGDGCPDLNMPKLCEEVRNPEYSEVCYQIWQKEDARRVGQAAAGGSAAGTIVAAVFGGPAGAGLGLLFEVQAHTFNAWGTTVAILDPPDLNYEVCVKPHEIPFKLFAGQDRETQIKNHLLASGINAVTAIQTFVSANEKYLGAQEAKNNFWQNIHATEVRKYAKSSSFALRDYGNALDELKSYFIEKNINESITKKQLIDLQNRLRQDGIAGLPQGEVDIAENNFYFSNEDIQGLVDTIVRLDQNAWVDEPMAQKIESLKQASLKWADTFDNIASLPHISFIKTTSLPQRNAATQRQVWDSVRWLSDFFAMAWQYLNNFWHGNINCVSLSNQQ